jgi:hypothetical protein
MILVQVEPGTGRLRNAPGSTPLRVVCAGVAVTLDLSLLHLGRVPWATFGQAVGKRDLAVTANTYSHVLTDESKLDYAKRSA